MVGAGGICPRGGYLHFKEHLETQMISYIYNYLMFEIQLVNLIVRVIILTGKK
jgi:hypothetical protein